jgi:hypothetical protein
MQDKIVWGGPTANDDAHFNNNFLLNQVCSSVGFCQLQKCRRCHPRGQQCADIEAGWLCQPAGETRFQQRGTLCYPVSPRLLEYCRDEPLGCPFHSLIADTLDGVDAVSTKRPTKPSTAGRHSVKSVQSVNASKREGRGAKRQLTVSPVHGQESRRSD